MPIKSYTKNISHLILTEPHKIGNITCTWQIVFLNMARTISLIPNTFLQCDLPKFPSTGWALYTLTLAFFSIFNIFLYSAAWNLSCGMWDSHSSTRDQTQAPCVGRTVLATGPPRKYQSSTLLVMDPHIPVIIGLSNVRPEPQFQNNN